MDKIIEKATNITGMPRKRHNVHSGPIHSTVAGRTDHLPMRVHAGSYVIPADIISALGEGNSMAGFKVAKSIFDIKDPYGQSGMPYGANSLPYNATKPFKAAGGGAGGAAGVGAGDLNDAHPGFTHSEAQQVPIVAAGGEFVIQPEKVVQIGKGSLDDGHKILDHFVIKMRSRNIKTLKNLPGPEK